LHLGESGSAKDNALWKVNLTILGLKKQEKFVKPSKIGYYSRKIVYL
jgi:hypothetical protein